jgi:undecaprenyl-diphosphatase
VDLLSAALLGVVQGLTEFLPVSSSGHLILARAFFGWDAGRFGLAFDVALHLGTLVAVVAYFGREVWRLLRAAPGALAGRPGEWERLGRLILVGTVPIVIVGLLFADAIENGVRSPAVVAVTLALGAVGLVAAERFGAQRRHGDSIGYGEALAIGTAQAAALVPGVSRSGATITLAMLLGFRREQAARFTFLLSLPAVAAAAGREGLELARVGIEGIPLTLFAVGIVVSGVVGYATVKYLIQYLARHSLTVFAVYRLALAGVTVAWLATGRG